MLAEDTFQAINGPVEAGRQRASGLRFADRRVHALWQALILFRQSPEGFRAADLRRYLAALSGSDTAQSARDQQGRAFGRYNENVAHRSGKRLVHHGGRCGARSRLCPDRKP